MSDSKTYTERLELLEQTVVELQQKTQALESAVSFLSGSMQEFVNQSRTQNDVVLAILDLQKDGIPATADKVENHLTDKKVLQIRDLVKQELDKGSIEESESVESEESVVLYSTNDIKLAINPVSSFTSEEIRKEILGKKAGDVVGPLTLEKVFKAVKKEETKA